MIRLLCIAEIDDAYTTESAKAALDAFREAANPSENYGVVLYQTQCTLTQVVLALEAGLSCARSLHCQAAAKDKQLIENTLLQLGETQ